MPVQNSQIHQIRRQEYPTRSILLGGTAIIGGLFGLSVLFGSWYTIQQTERGVLLTNGALTSVVDPGLHFKTPFIQSVYKVDMQTHNRAFDGKQMQAYSSDTQLADLKVSVTYHVDPTKIEDLYTKFGGDPDIALEKLVRPHIYAQTKVVFGGYQAQKAITARGQLNIDVLNEITKAMQYDPIITIESIQVEAVDFSKAYNESVEQRMQAEVEVAKVKQHLERTKIEATMAVTTATGAADSVRAKADADSYATRVAGEGEAAAIKAKNDALNNASPNFVAYTYATKYKGEVPHTILPGSTMPFFDINSIPTAKPVSTR